MKTLSIFLISFFCIISFARAEDAIELSIPHSELAPVEKIEISKSNLKYMNFSVSTWAPSELSQDSRLPGTSEFTKTGQNKFSISYSSPLLGFESSLLSTQFGLAYLQMQRSGQLRIETTEITVNHQASLYQALMGLEWKTQKEYFLNSKFFVTLSASPTWIQSTKSEFNSGVNDWQWMTLASIGVQLPIRHLGRWMGFDDMTVNIAVEQSKDLSGRSLDGSGVVIGTNLGWY